MASPFDFESFLNRATTGGSAYTLQPQKKRVGKATPSLAEPIYDEYGFPTSEYLTGKPSYPNLLKRSVEIGVGGVEKIKAGEEFFRKEAPGRAKYLAEQVRGGRLSPQEAATQFEEFGTSYKIPGTYETAAGLSKLAPGTAPSGSQFRPFTQTATQLLGLGQLSPEQLKGYEKAAQAVGKTSSPEAFSQFLGQALMSSPDYLRKNPLAFTANLPFGGQYGVPHQAGGSVTGTFRFKPPSFA